MEIVTYLLALVVGFIGGALVTRNNVKRVNAVVTEAKEIAEKVDQKVDELSAVAKKKATRKTNQS